MSGGGVVEGFPLRRGLADFGGGLFVGIQPCTIMRNNMIEKNVTGIRITERVGGDETGCAGVSDHPSR